MSIRHLTAISAALLISLTACSSTNTTYGTSAVKPAAITTATMQNQLGDYLWTLETATDANQQPIHALQANPKMPLSLTFAEQRIQIFGGCNRMGGQYTITAQKQLETSALFSTRMGCEAPLMKMDDTISALLAKPWGIAMHATDPVNNQAQLILTSAQGRLVFKGQATPEKLYGAGQQIFLEVAAHKVACNHPLMPEMKCLQIRERTYNSNGLVVGQPGAWSAMYDPIEGYTHAEGTRNVLRLKRFERQNVPADASKYVYILDMVVESELMQGH